MAEIASACKEQAGGLEQINRAVSELDTAVQQTAAQSQESAAAAEEMKAQSEQMQQFIRDLRQTVRGANGTQNGSQNGARGISGSLPKRLARLGNQQTDGRPRQSRKVQEVIPFDEDFDAF